MKRLSAIAFALTALASSAVAQSIVVVDKDGNQHKFCTDYVQDITFEVVDNRPNYSFSQIDVNPYGGVNVGLELKTAEGVTAAFDLYMADPSVILADGTYIFGATEGNRIDVSDSQWTYFSPDGTAKQAFKSGTMTISHNSEAVYTISFEAVLADGSEVLGSYEGKLNKMSPIVDVKLTTIKQVDTRDPKSGEFYLRLSDVSYNYEAVFDLFCEAGATVVADGTYTLAETNAALTFSAKTGIDMYNPYAQLKITSPIEVKTEAGVTTMTTTVVDGEITYNITAEGAIEYLAPKTPEGVKYNNLDVTPYGLTEVILEFKTSDQPTVKVDIYFKEDQNFLPDGVYNLGTDGDRYIKNISSNKTFCNIAGKLIKSGSMNVVRKGEEYTISFDFTYGDDNENIKGYYQGTLNNFGPVKNVVATNMVASDNDDLKDGEFYLKFNDADWSVDGIFDLFCAPGLMTIPDGTYTLGADNSPMTYSAKSQIHSYTFNQDFKIVEPIVVATENGERTITTKVTTDLGVIFNITYKGAITYVSK